MKSEEELVKLGYAIQEYLLNSKMENAKPKDVMPFLIEKGFFRKDHRDGLPLRDLLRNLEKDYKLYLIPQVRYEQKAQNKFWFFNALEF